jgi:hypothetical protein
MIKKILSKNPLFDADFESVENIANKFLGKKLSSKK